MCHHSPQQKSWYRQYLHHCDHSQGVQHLLNSWYHVPDHPVATVNIIITLYSLAMENRGEEQLQVPRCGHLPRSAASLFFSSSLPNTRWVHHIFPELLLAFVLKRFPSPFKAPTCHKPLFISQNKMSHRREATPLSSVWERLVSNLSSCTCSSASSPALWSGSNGLVQESMQLHSHSTLLVDSSFTPFHLSWRYGGVKMHAFECKSVFTLEQWFFKSFFQVTDWPQKKKASC